MNGNNSEDNNAVICIAKTNEGKSIIEQVRDGGLLAERTVEQILFVNKGDDSSVIKRDCFEKLIDRELQDSPVLQRKQLRLTPEAIFALATKKDSELDLEIREGKVIVLTEDSDDDVSLQSVESLQKGKDEGSWMTPSDIHTETTSQSSDVSYTSSFLAEELSCGSSVVTIGSSVGPGASPPKGISEGGQWVTRRYHGKHTMIGFVLACLCGCGVGGPLVLCCPLDEDEVYLLDGSIYNEGGECLGTGHTCVER